MSLSAPFDLVDNEDTGTYYGCINRQCFILYTSYSCNFMSKRLIH